MSLCQCRDENVSRCVLQSHFFVPPFTPTEIQYCLIFFLPPPFFAKKPPRITRFPRLSLASSSVALSFRRVQKSLHILEVINLVCRSFSSAAVRCESCISVILSLAASISVTDALFNHSVPFSLFFFFISQHLQKRKMMQDIWMWLCQK